MSETYTKLFGSILHSSVWREPLHVKVTWITMLALADKDGYVGASVPGLADAAGVSLDQVQEALASFLSPDQWSRSKEYEGRRIEEEDRGWNILNYDRFRDMRDEEVRREYERKRKRVQRAKGTVPDTSGQTGTVPECPPMSRVSAQAEADQIQIRLRSEGDQKRSDQSDPLTSHGLMILIQTEVEAAHPELGLYIRGEWAAKSAREFCESIPAEKRTDATRDEIRRRARAFAASTDKRITRGKWDVQAFCSAFNELAPASGADKVAQAVAAMAAKTMERYG